MELAATAARSEPPDRLMAPSAMSDGRRVSALDPDAPGPVHLRPRLLLLVAAGGTVGTGAREAVSLAVPTIGGFPLAVFAINLAGALLLGLLLESLLRRGADTGVRRLLRLGLGTGFCGGFTTYSALASATAVLLADGRALLGVAYALGTVLAGALTTGAGIALGTALDRGRP